MSTPTPRYGNPTVQFRVAPDLLDEIRQRAAPSDGSDGETARMLLARHFSVLAAELRSVPFSAEEAALVCDALNGVWMHDYSLGSPELVLRSWWMEVEDHIRLNRADRRWGVKNPAVLVSKCRTMSPGMSAAVLDAATRWWHRKARSGETIAESLHAVGLIRSVPDSVAWDTGEPEGEEWRE